MGTGREGSGFPAHSAMFLSESLDGERCCPLADWYLSGRNAERGECLGREAGGPCRERGELPFRPSAAFQAWALRSGWSSGALQEPVNEPSSSSSSSSRSLLLGADGTVIG